MIKEIIRTSLKIIFLFLFLLFISCTSLKETILKENPDFIKHAYNFKITSPLAHDNASFNKFIIEDPDKKKIYEVEPVFEEVESNHYKIEKDPNKDDYYDNVDGTKEVAKYNFLIFNPLDEKEYLISGTTTTIRTKEGKNDVIIGSPKEKFMIYEGEKRVGEITTEYLDPMTLYKLIFPLKISLHSRNFNIEYQKIMNKKSITFKDENGLIALLSFETEGFIAVKYTGEAFIKQGLTNELRSDIIVMFIITDTVWSIIENVRF
jgi:hypothetical protein